LVPKTIIPDISKANTRRINAMSTLFSRCGFILSGEAKNTPQLRGYPIKTRVQGLPLGYTFYCSHPGDHVLTWMRARLDKLILNKIILML